MAGWRLRGYAIEQLLGHGASSEVWRARVAGSGEPVALKRLYVTDDDQVRRATAEAALLSVLDHPNLVRLHAVVPTPEAAVLVLDLAEGGSLANLLAVRGRLTPGEVITAIAPVAAALAYVHRCGVIHGDVSAANVLFTPGGVSLLADLGVARLTGDERDAESTPAYIDPLVAQGSVPAAPSDVFMLAAVALHALTGSPLWTAPDTAGTLAIACGADVSAVASRLDAAGVPAGTAAVICRALVVDPVLRCTAADFALDLRHSGTPVAVELRAGRPVPATSTAAATVTPPASHARFAPPVEVPQYGQTAPRLTSGAASSSYTPRHAGLGATGPGLIDAATDAMWTSDASSGPAASRAPDSPGVPGAPPPTSAIHRPRPVIPRHPPRRVGRRRVAVVITALAVAVILAAVTAGLLTRARPAPPQRDVAGRATATGSPTRVDWVAALRSIDDARAEAFADRDPALFEQVYVAGALRTADTALLTRLVPAGCSLSGATTRYDAIHVRPTQDGRRAVVTTRASIASSVLHCAGRPDRVAGAVPATAMTVDLVSTPAGPRISALRPG